MKKSSKNNQTDQALINEFRDKGDIHALETLIVRYSERVQVLCSKYLSNNDTDDAVCEIFEKIMDVLKKQTICNFKSWIFVVTKNHCLMKKRQADRESLQLYDPSEIENFYVENDEDEHHTYIDKIEPEEVNNAINQLKESQRICIRYFYFSKMSYKEIADSTGFEINQIKSHIQNGKRNLKNIILKNLKAQNGKKE